MQAKSCAAAAVIVVTTFPEALRIYADGGLPGREESMAGRHERGPTPAVFGGPPSTLSENC